MTEPAKIARVAVIGAGTMGHGIAQVSAAAGYTTFLHDVTPELIERGYEAIQSSLFKAVSKGKISMEDQEHVLLKLKKAPALADAVASADLVIEAAPEKLDLKRAIFRDAAAKGKPGAILATNTSSLSIGAIAEAVPSPERVVGMHFFNPPPIMKLLEVVRGPATSDATVATVLEVGRRMQKESIVVRDSPGFATSRLGLAIGLEAMRMFEEGVASAADIDRAMELGYNHPMGPLKLTDLVGLDVRLAIAEYLERELKTDRFKPPPILRKLVAEGKLGKKTGEGFHKWDPAK